MPITKHLESHRIEHINWLRAAVLGANDGIISTASLLVSLVAAHTDLNNLIIAGIAALVAGAFSMAAGEYISVSSQKDTEKAALAKETHELSTNYAEEIKELTEIYINHGLSEKLAHKVALKLMEHNALQIHAKEELGITAHLQAKPIQAALFSACSFSFGSMIPILILLITQTSNRIPVLAISSIILLGLLGAIAAKIGGANTIKGALRVILWGSLAFSISIYIGSLLG